MRGCTRRIITSVIALGALLGTLLTAIPAGAAGGSYVNWTTRDLSLSDTGRFTVDFCEGDAPFLCVAAGGRELGAIELSRLGPVGQDHVIVREGWAAWAEQLYKTVRDDRRQACDPGYVVDAEPVVAAPFAGSDGARYGFVGRRGDGRVAERTLIHGVVHEGELYLLNATGFGDASCLGRETEMTLDAFPDIVPVVSQIAKVSVLPGSGLPVVRRFSGPDRYATAASSAKGSFTEAEHVVLASGEGFADALAATYAAGRFGAPVLLTERGRLTPETAATLESLRADHIVVVGGTAAVGDSVVTTLRSKGYEVERMGGADRYRTAAAVASAFGPDGVGSLEPGGARAAIVVTGESFADALAAGPVAYAGSLPIVLTPAAQLEAAARDTLRNLGVKKVLVVGGTQAISTKVVDDIAALGIQTVRVQGADRTATAAAVALYAVQYQGFERHAAVIARSDQFADALAAGSHAGSRRAALVLAAAPADLGLPTTRWLETTGSEINQLHVLGGTGALTDGVVEAARRATAAQ